MPKVDMTIEICGMSGDGTIAAGALLNEAMSAAGFSVLAFDSYPAEIRGFGRCVTRSRIGDEDTAALGDETHVLISLDDQQSLSRLPGLAAHATVYFDSKPPTFVSEDRSIAAHVAPDVNLYGIPFGDLAAASAGTTRGRNLTALGGFAAVMGMSQEPFRQAIRGKFGNKGEKVLEANLRSFDAGYAYALERFSDRIADCLGAGAAPEVQERTLLSGNEAIATGALDAGLTFYYGYPITPATPIMEHLAKALPERGGRVTQMEDEIASIGAVLGSFFAGKRAMTATSGPGLALMTELITHGVMSETPAVIVNAQRGGPATGLPTKTEQSDLHAAVFGGPGDSARIVTAPTNVTECYRHTLRSFHLAEKYQTPVIVLTDFFLDNRVENVVAPRAAPEDCADGNVYPESAVRGAYRRYEYTESGISPRAVPGMEGYIFAATGLEHSEKGVPDYTADNHMKMSRKRHVKILSALADLPKPEEFSDGGALEVGVISWGSTFGSAREAASRARKKGLRVGALKVSAIFPYHAEEIRSFMDRCDEILIPELNYEGQLANVIGHLHRKDVARLNQVTGVPMPVRAILERIEELCAKK
jgi:2-oxoglutarate ferredoxin oxidoreductase subunit alpha